MDIFKRNQINRIVENEVDILVSNLSKKFLDNELENNNIFINALGTEFVFFSMFIRSFESSLGNMIHRMANRIMGLSFEEVQMMEKPVLMKHYIRSLDSLMDSYERGCKPETSHYKMINFPMMSDDETTISKFTSDHCFYNKEKKEYYIIELKSGGDLDNKKAKSEKQGLLKQYFILRNAVGSDSNISIYFATAYNKDGEGEAWKQGRVRKYFADDELLIGSDYWNFVCDDIDGYDIIMKEYNEQSKKIMTLKDKIYKKFL